MPDIKKKISVNFNGPNWVIFKKGVFRGVMGVKVNLENIKGTRVKGRREENGDDLFHFRYESPEPMRKTTSDLFAKDEFEIIF